ncbi:AN1-type zinc finger protein 4 [Anabrus simplex]|uniref:AN1-type zinc finger protein 4 n=1 Tax=Anabrus simplex TaxID=316456 RepID=UPI0035A2748B
MMSQHGFQETLQASLRPEGTMDLFIETLTGTAFEMTVSPFDTIMSIKSKIQKVEGIPVSHQHLLYNMQELDDSLCLLDYSIQNGATLKLVLSMRGGPISTRRLPSGDEFAWKELREFVETNRDDMFENLPPGCRVTVLVFRDGDQVNLFRVIENEDGTYSPLSESWSGSSIRNLFAEEDPDEAARRLQENSVTMGKMQELRSKMEELALQRKPKKSVPQATATSGRHPTLHLRKDTPQPLVNPRSSSPEPHDPIRSRSQQNFLHLPPIQRAETIPAAPTRSQQSLANRSSLLNPLYQPVSRRSREVQNKMGRREIPNTEGQRNRITKRDLKDSVKQPSLPLVMPKPEIRASSRRGGRVLPSTFPDMKPQRCLEYGAARNIRRSETERELKPLIDDGESISNCTNVLSTSNIAIVEEESDSTIEKEEPDFPPPPSPIPVPSKEATTFTVSQMPRERVTSAVGSSNVYRVSRFVLDEDDRPKTSPDKLPQQHKTQEICDLLSEANWRRHRHQPLHCSNTQMDILRGVPRTADGEFASGNHLRNKRGLERSRVDLAMPVESSLVDVTIRSPRYGRRSIIIPSNSLDSNQERSKSGTSQLLRQDIALGTRHLRQTRPRVPFLSQGSVLLQSDRAPISQEQIHPPPILPPVKKTSVRSRCAACRKKLNITNQYTCRCEKLFCSAHRYSELHDCSFDYKSEGRKLLEQANPLVTAPKLPKI